MMVWRHYVYEHRRVDTGAVFYVGKGAARKRCKRHGYERAHAQTGRNKWWHRIVAKADGFGVEIVAHFRCDDDAVAFEVARIKERGRKSLVNLTDGGDGRRNGVFSQEEMRKRRIAAQAPRSEAFKASLRKAKYKGGNGGVVKRGDKLPIKWRAQIAKAKLGARNPMYGRTGVAHPNSRAVVSSAGERFPSVTAAATARDIAMKTLHNMLSGHRPNSTDLRFADKP